MTNIFRNQPLPDEFVEVYVDKGFRGIENVFDYNRNQTRRMIMKAGGKALLDDLRRQHLLRERAKRKAIGAGSQSSVTASQRLRR